MSDRDQSPVPPWRLVAGVLLHGAILAYLVAVPLLCLLLAPPGASAETLARLALTTSLWVLGGLAALAAGVLPLAVLSDRATRGRRRRNASDPAARSRALVAAAAGDPPDGATAPLLARIAAAPWDHDDPRCQALARDLAEVVDAARTALASAPPERRADLSAAAAQSLACIADEVDALAAARSAADEEQLVLLSHYVQTRYPALDSPLRPD